MLQKRDRKLGWFTSAALVASLFLSSLPARALDVGREVRRIDQDSAQILSTLGRDKRPAKMGVRSGGHEMRVKLIKRTKARKRG